MCLPVYEIKFVLNVTEGGFSNYLIHECRNLKECGRYFIEHDAKMIEMEDWYPKQFGPNLFKLVLTCPNWSKHVQSSQNLSENV